VLVSESAVNSDAPAFRNADAASTEDATFRLLAPNKRMRFAPRRPRAVTQPRAPADFGMPCRSQSRRRASTAA